MLHVLGPCLADCLPLHFRFIPIETSPSAAARIGSCIGDGTPTFLGRVEDAVVDTVETQIKRLDEFAEWIEKGGPGASDTTGPAQKSQPLDVEMGDSES